MVRTVSRGRAAPAAPSVVGARSTGTPLGARSSLHRTRDLTVTTASDTSLDVDSGIQTHPHLAE